MKSVYTIIKCPTVKHQYKWAVTKSLNLMPIFSISPQKACKTLLKFHLKKNDGNPE